jgi:tRNA threonylcarbamoyladenosine modification (KEOPS) complex Cgi121 subunit
MVLEHWLGPQLGVVKTRVSCTTLTPGLKEVIELRNRRRDCYISIVPLRVVEKHGLESTLSAHHAALLAYRRGSSIARRKGLDTLLLLAGERNIRKILDTYAPNLGEKTVVIATPAECVEDISPGEEEGEACKVPASKRLDVTRVSCSVVEARIYRRNVEE